MIDSLASIVVTGSAGQLGAAMVKRLSSRAIGVARHKLDVTSDAGIQAMFLRYRPTAVINCAAYTQVDQAESDTERCFAVNATAVEHLAAHCERHGATLVQISTDYVFGGPPLGRPWRETDSPLPSSVYARSKLAGEIAAASCPRHFVVRTCGLYGGGPRHVSFVEKMLQLAQSRRVLRVVSDQRCTPTHVADVAEAIAFLLTTSDYGIYHVTNAGETNWHEFACEVFRLSRLDVDVQPITTAEFGSPAARPACSVLDNEKYRQLGGLPLRPWREALVQYLCERSSFSLSLWERAGVRA